MSRFLPALAASALFLLALGLFTRHHEFPFYYHPDEAGKVEQVLGEKLNFHHPPLMIETARLAVPLFGVERSEQAVVVAGRWVSATFAALAVAALALLAWSLRGPVAGLFTGALLLTHHQLFELAHYFKEDTALLMGIAVAMLGAVLTCQRRSASRVLLLGVGCALAISGKYLGAVMLIPAAIALVRPARPWPAIALFLGTLAIALAALNFPLLQDLATARASFSREAELVAGGQGGMTGRGLNFAYLHAFRDNTTAALTPLLALLLYGAWRQRRTLSRAEWLVIGFPFVFMLALSFSPKTNDRYFLPATAFFVVLAALAATEAYRHLRGRFSHVLAGLLCFGLPLGLQIPDLWSYDAAFQVDDRAALAAWLRTELPATEVLGQDRRVNLKLKQKEWQRFAPPIPQRVASQNLQSDFHSLAELRAAGLTVAVVSESDYGRYFLKSLRPQENYAAEFAEKKRLYEELFATGELVWKRPRGTVLYLHPGLEVYRLRPL